MLYIVERIEELRGRIEQKPSKRILNKIKKMESKYIIDNPPMKDVERVYIDKKTGGKVVVTKDKTAIAIDTEMMYPPHFYGYAIAYAILLMISLPAFLFTIGSDSSNNLIQSSGFLLSGGGLVLGILNLQVFRSLLKKKKVLLFLVIMVVVINGINLIGDIFSLFY